MCAFEDNFWRHASLEGLDPAACAKAPAVASVEARKSVLGVWGAQIVSLLGGELEERVRDNGADNVKAVILGVLVAAPGPRETGERISAARFEVGAQNVSSHRGESAGIGPE